MGLACRKCGGAVGVEAVDLDRGIARCRACGAAFALALGAVEEDAQPGEAAARLRVGAEDEIPAGVDVRQTESGLRIRLARVPTYGTAGAILALLGGCAVLLLLLLPKTSGVSSRGTPPLSDYWFVVLSFSAALLYGGAAELLNRTRIDVTGTELVISVGPLPFEARLHASRLSLVQLYCITEVRSHRLLSQCSFSVAGKRLDGGWQRLVPQIETLEEAVAVERLIERAWGIEQRGVAGETVA